MALSSRNQKSYRYDSLPPPLDGDRGIELTDDSRSHATASSSSNSPGWQSSSWKTSFIFAWLGMAALVIYVFLPSSSGNDIVLSSAYLWGDRAQPLALSLWLLPPPEIANNLQPLIDEASDMMQPDASVTFRPHITITGAGLARSEHELYSIALALKNALLQDAALAKGIDCRFETYPQTNTDEQQRLIWSQALILKMNISSSFEQICQASRRALKMDDNLSLNCHNPHMSLLYSDKYPSPQVHDVADSQLQNLLPLQFTSTRVALYAIDPVSVKGVQYWAPVSEFSLGDGVQ